jgi:hypothetical protein
MGTETSARQQRRHQHDKNGAKTRNEASNTDEDVEVFFPDGGRVSENRKTASDDTQVSLGISGILALV